ncbi:MAG: CAP domain-containing protein [Pirellulales bacterium]
MFAHLLAASLSLTLGAEAARPAVSPYDVAPHLVETQVMAGVNAQRARNGLRPLTLDRGLLRSARIHTAWMARNSRLQHTSAPVGENIAEGQSSAHEAVNDWMNSPGHRANILNGSYNRIGMAAYTSPTGRIFWCTQFLQ